MRASAAAGTSSSAASAYRIDRNIGPPVAPSPNSRCGERNGGSTNGGRSRFGEKSVTDRAVEQRAHPHQHLGPRGGVRQLMIEALELEIIDRLAGAAQSACHVARMIDENVAVHV